MPHPAESLPRSQIIIIIIIIILTANGFVPGKEYSGKDAHLSGDFVATRGTR
jgi:hypothetical protein